MSKLHEEVLYPCVRVRANRGGGSGTAIYSKQNVRGEWDNYIITCYHVIESAISIKEKWDHMVGRARKFEDRDLIKVEFFEYEHITRAIGTYGVEAEIKAWDEIHDIALLKLKQTSKSINHICKSFPYDKTKEIHQLDKVYIVGCALGHPPIITHGRITSMSDNIEGMSYWMSDAQIIYGNSGGAVFHAERNEFIGIPSRVAIVGWVETAISHMGYFSDIERIYKVLDRWCYQFLYNSEYTPEQCDKMREKITREDLELRKRGFIEEEK